MMLYAYSYWPLRSLWSQLFREIWLQKIESVIVEHDDNVSLSLPTQRAVFLCAGLV